MKRFVLLFVFLGSVSYAQTLRDLNYSYLYDPSQPVTLDIRLVRKADTWDVFYKVQLRDTLVSELTIEWSTRTGLSDKDGVTISTPSPNREGNLRVPISASVQLLVAKVVSVSAKQAWLYYRVLDPKYPVNGWLTADGGIVLVPYIKGDKPYRVQGGSTPLIVSHYRDTFPAANPAFSEALGKVAPILKVDSTFVIQPDQDISFVNQGLYLVQHDTTSSEGFAFRVQHDYPRLTKLESLADPFIYVCTRQEYDRLKQAKGDKKAFDKVILSITGDTERAKQFMRTYFRRVELANQFFTSYKEGWKTDRGMIYIVFGLPDEVYKFADRETWNYKNSGFKVSFDFVKSPTLFDPDNYVMIRDKKFTQTWYEVIDLWRNARF
ncbi:MAG TPA: GWxTD domain-containing protein [Ohtaekwangia sp.]|uniref:GWxTD domain-containing protein n=1 Tax=Ohtaekwangia sp. TaxID=2066019 RepID=UPI002F95CA98